MARRFREITDRRRRDPEFRRDVTADGDTFVVNSRGRIVLISRPADVRRGRPYLGFSMARSDNDWLVVWELDGILPGGRIRFDIDCGD